MPRRLNTIGCCMLVLWHVSAAVACCDQPGVAGGATGAATDAAPWLLDRIVLNTGQVVRGLIESESEATLRVLELRWPEGRGMYAVSLPIEQQTIAEIQRLTSKQRDESRARFERFRNRARVEAGKMDDLVIESTVEAGRRTWKYRGDWFWLQSTATEDMTRQAIVRIEQVFGAFRQLAPPRTRPQSRPRVMLFGSTAEYRTFLREQGLPLDHPALFVGESNLMAAGSDLNKFSEQLAQVQAQHDGLRTQIEQVRRELPEKMKQKRLQLDAAAGTEVSRRKAMLTFKRQCDDELAALQRSLDSSDRKNATLFQELTGRMFARLYHEAFHAYLENYIYPHRQFDVPRWLNEGLAQVFEAGVLEAETLRVDAANKTSLDTLQADLQSPRPLKLSQVLSADRRNFLVAHGDGVGTSSLHYAYSWGLAHYLTFERPVLGGAALDEYVALGNNRAEAVARFERLTGTPLDDFEPRWRKYILALKATSADERKPPP